MNTKPHIFVSLSNDEEFLVNKLQKSSGFEFHIAKRTHSLTGTMNDKIKKMINRCDIAIVLYTKKGAESAFVNQEIGYLEGIEKEYIVLYEKGVELNGFLYGKAGVLEFKNTITFFRDIHKTMEIFLEEKIPIDSKETLELAKIEVAKVPTKGSGNAEEMLSWLLVLIFIGLLIAKKK